MCVCVVVVVVVVVVLVAVAAVLVLVVAEVVVVSSSSWCSITVWGSTLHAMTPFSGQGALSNLAAKALVPGLKCRTEG